MNKKRIFFTQSKYICFLSNNRTSAFLFTKLNLIVHALHLAVFVNKINNLATQSWKKILAFASQKIKKNNLA